MSNVWEYIVDDHEPALVIVAACLCVLGCLTTINLLARAQKTSGRRSRFWTCAAAVEFGGAVWALHFVAMLGFLPGSHITYALAPTALSASIAVAGTMASFATLRAVRRRIVGVLASALLLTAGIGGMHYLGAAAMRFVGTTSYDATSVLCSFIACACLSIPAMTLATDLSRLSRRLGSSALLCGAVCVLHFTGMSAMRMPSGLVDAAHPGFIGSAILAAVVSATSVAILSVSLILVVIDQHLEEWTGRERLRLRQLVGVSFEGLLVERDGRVLEVNDRLADMCGETSAQLVGREITAVLRSRSAHGRSISSIVDPTGESFELLRGLDDPIPVELLIRKVTYDQGPATAIAVRDLTARYESEARILHHAQHDPLTGLANRALLGERLSVAMKAATVSNLSVSMLCVDLDRFKPVNDTLGHDIGDKLLLAVSSRLTALTRASDTVARCGGDEFVVLLAAHDGPYAASLASRIVVELASTFVIDGQDVDISASVGVAMFPRDATSGPELLRCADIAMYRAKREGRGGFCNFERGMDEELRSRRSLERDLRAAIGRGELALHYQPLVDCQSGLTDGFEALLRWSHPTRGNVPPSDFIPLAEETGAITSIGRWVLVTACREAASWARDLRIAVNVSAVQFRQGDLAAEVFDVLNETGLDPARLEIEVTESVLIDDPSRAMDVLSRLRTLGVVVSLDDFGTGYSSLSYLRSYPFDKIKIDRSFVAALGDSPRANSVVRAVVALGHSLDLHVIAEGVETQTQLDILQSHRCDQVQGFLLGRPGPRERYIDILSTRMPDRSHGLHDLSERPVAEAA